MAAALAFRITTVSPFFNVYSTALVVLTAARRFNVVDTTLPSNGTAVAAGVAMGAAVAEAVVAAAEAVAVALGDAVGAGVAVGPVVVLAMYCDDT